MNAQTLDLRTLARALRGEISGDQVLAPGPNHSEADRSLAVRLDRDNPDGFVVFSHAGDDPLACRDHVRSRAGMPGFAPRQPEARVVNEYIYRLADGTPHLRVQRTRDKTFWQAHWTGSEWARGKPPGDVVPYRLPELLGAIHDTVLIVEGEKDADRLAGLGFIATTAPGGAGKWRPELTAWFRGKDVLILADNDEPGRRHAVQVAESLLRVAAAVRVVELPGLPAKGDVSDWLDAGGDPAGLIDLCRAVPPHSEKSAEGGSENLAAPCTATPHAKALRLDFYGDIAEVQKPKGALIKGVLYAGERSAWIAPPKGGKSALLTSVCFAVASGRDWRGYRVKERGGVLYLAYERSGDLKRQLAAYKARCGIADLPIAIAGTTLNLMDAECVEVITATMQAMEQRTGVPVRLIVIDTFAKAISAGGGDENLPKDQGKLLVNLERITAATGAHIAIIGHTGKDETRGMRGANAVLGDVDVMVEITTDQDGVTRRAAITAANDRGTGHLTTFRLIGHVFGQDEDGDDIRTRIVDPEPVVEAEQSTQMGQFRRDTVPRNVPRGKKGHLVRIVEKALSEAGERPPPSDHIPPGALVVSRDTIRAYAKTAGYRDENSVETFKRTFNRDLSDLAGDGVIVIHADQVWMTGRGSSGRDNGTMPGQFEVSRSASHCHETTKPPSATRDGASGTVAGQSSDAGQGHRDISAPPKGGSRESVPDVPASLAMAEAGHAVRH
jgi:hypothetical protein